MIMIFQVENKHAMHLSKKYIKEEDRNYIRMTKAIVYFILTRSFCAQRGHTECYWFMIIIVIGC